MTRAAIARGSVATRLREVWRTWLRYRTYRLELQPVHDLVVTPSGFRSTGSDPQFRLASGTGRVPSGWTRLRYRAAAEAGYLQPKIYIDQGAGFTEAVSVRLPYATGQTQDFFVNLPPGTAMRLDPCEHPGDFAMSPLEVTEYGRVALAVQLAWRQMGDVVRNHGALPGKLRSASRMWREGGLDAVRDRLKQVLASREDYDNWVLAFDTPSAARVALHRQRAAALKQYPTVSILMPVFDPPERLLRESIASVRAQIYPHWQLCIADDASTQPHVMRVLEEEARDEPRIVITRRERNGHISAASNTALGLATGELVGFLDHDDVLAPHALSCVVERFNETPFDLAYSDEDHIDLHERRYHPFFKPDWNEELFLSVNYLCHFTVVRAALLRAVGGFREGFEGAQDYDLFLRLVQRIDPARIAHIPRVLYHWRAHAGSTALAHGEKSYAVPAGLRSLAEHLAATGVRAVAEPGLKPTIYRVRWAVPEPAPLASIVIATRDRIALLSTCIESIRARTTYRPYEIVVADNDSVEPETRTYLAQLVREGVARVVPYPGAFNFSAINNAAARQSGGDVLVFVNNDVEVIEPEWLTELVAQASRPEIGAVGAKLLYADGRLQHAGLILGIGGVAGHAFKRFPRDTLGANGRAVMIQAVSAVTAACMAVRREVFDEVGGFDAQALAVAFNDVDFCLRVMRAGYRNVYTPYALLYHHESASRGSDDVPEKAARFQAEVEVMLDRWGDALGRDFAYNPNLTLGAEDFGLAWPPRIAD